MTTIAYIANEFPSPLEPYVIDEITELRRRGMQRHLLQRKAGLAGMISAWRSAPFGKRRVFFSRSPTMQLLRAVRRLASDRRNLWQLVHPLLLDRGCVPRPPRSCASGHTIMGAALAEELAPLECRTHPCSPWILRIVDGLGRGQSAGYRIQFYPAWL